MVHEEKIQFKAHQIILKIFFKNMLFNFCKSKAHPTLGLCERAICCLWLHVVLSGGLYGRRGALLVMPSQSLLVLVRQSVLQSNLYISVSYHSCSKVKWWREKKKFFIETEITLFQRKELCQETIQSKKLIYRELLYPLLVSPAGSIISFVTILIFVYL